MKKATWLYAYGVELPELPWGWTRDSDGNPENQNDHGGLDAWRDTWGGRRAAWEESTESVYNDEGVRCRPSHLGQSSTTPPAFRDVLLNMARSAQGLAQHGQAETGVDSQPPTRPQSDTSRRKEDATP